MSTWRGEGRKERAEGVKGREGEGKAYVERSRGRRHGKIRVKYQENKY